VLKRPVNSSKPLSFKGTKTPNKAEETLRQKKQGDINSNEGKIPYKKKIKEGWALRGSETGQITSKALKIQKP